MFKRLVCALIIMSVMPVKLVYANEVAEFWGTKGVVEEVGKLMDYVIIDGARCKMNAATKVVDKKGKPRTRGAIKIGMEIQVFFDINKNDKPPPLLNKIIIVRGPLL